MKPLFCKKLPYNSDSTQWFLRVASWQNPVWLDSNGSSRGRYDVISADPIEWLQFERGIRGSEAGFLSSLRKHLDDEAYSDQVTGSDLPFNGGMIGQLGYTFGLGMEDVVSSKPGFGTADAEVGVYDWAIIQDHHRKQCTYVSRKHTAAALSTLERIRNAESLKPSPFRLTDSLRPAVSEKQYQESFDSIQEYILAGDCYQINIAQAYHGDYSGDPLAMYIQLRSVSSAPFAGYFKGNTGTILCLSPERLIESRGKDIRTQPIKGTVARGNDPSADQKNAESLRNSGKDQAENLMIVDLLRNDFGKVCEPGSVQVPDLFELQTFAAVHHLVSTVVGTLADDSDAIDGLAAVYPGGSITGAPKRRAMQIIEELEPFDRSVYCGSLFYLSYDGALDSNIMIRTLLCNESKVVCWGGGGIVVDSTADAEWAEIHSKIGHLLGALESTLV